MTGGFALPMPFLFLKAQVKHPPLLWCVCCSTVTYRNEERAAGKKKKHVMYLTATSATAGVLMRHKTRTQPPTLKLAMDMLRCQISFFAFVYPTQLLSLQTCISKHGSVKSKEKKKRANSSQICSFVIQLLLICCCFIFSFVSSVAFQLHMSPSMCLSSLARFLERHTHLTTKLNDAALCATEK
jgi:hypothetical protein